jgi:hypothetical protein
MLLLKSYADSNNPIAYYELLVEKGYSYGNLALGVIKNDSLAGVTARLYAEQVAKDVGVTLTDAAWQSITLELMQADLQAREQMFSADPSQPVELGWSPILDYHVAVFDRHQLPPDAWTAYTVLTGSFDGFADPDGAWEIMLDMGSTIPFDDIGSVFISWAGRDAFSASASWRIQRTVVSWHGNAG